MQDAWLLPHLIERGATRVPHSPALVAGTRTLDYAALWQATRACGAALAALGCEPNVRVAIWLDKRVETVVAAFAAGLAGLVFVPVNPLLKPAQVAHILRDSGASVLLASPERAAMLAVLTGL